MEELLFDIRSTPHFINENQTLSKSMLLSQDVGANIVRKKFKGITYKDELKVEG